MNSELSVRVSTPSELKNLFASQISTFPLSPMPILSWEQTLATLG